MTADLSERLNLRSLLRLPPEILSQIISYATTARTLRDVALTCRTLHRLVEADGYKSLVQERFPSFQTPPHWKDAAHALTTLSRNWDRKAILAKHFEPYNTTICILPEGRTEVIRGRWRRPQSQTMGYQPVIDSHEEWTDGDWTTRKEVVAWGAGAKLMVKIIHRGEEVVKEWIEAKKSGNSHRFDAHGNGIDWLEYQDPHRHREGRDDITTVNLLRHQELRSELVVVGRASGELTMLKLGTQGKSSIKQNFDTGWSLVRSTDVWQGTAPLLAACLGDTRAVLYNITGDEKKAKPTSEVQCVGEGEAKCRTWSTCFLSSNRLAIGRGASDKIVYVFNIDGAGLSEKPLRIFGTGRVDTKSQTSAYPICAVPDSNVAPQLSGNVFLSGGYDGFVRVHDMRSPSDCEAQISDLTDSAPIFSLLMIGRERILAGGAINALIKVFDIRMPGGKVYDYMDANLTTSLRSAEKPPSPAPSMTTSDSGTYSWKGWNLFASPRQESTARRPHRPESGPVYSLSRPSSSSPSLYVGLEGSVMHFNMSSMLDKHPDPVFGKDFVKEYNGRLYPAQRWAPDPTDPVLRLAMYEQTESGHIPLRTQAPFGNAWQEGNSPGYDSRWLDKSGVRNNHKNF